MKRLVRIAVVVALAILLWSAADGRAALARLAEASPVWLLLAGGALVVQTALSAQRWRLTAAQLGLHLPVWTALREYYLAQVVNQSLPGGVLGDAARAARTRAEAGLAVAAQAVVFERLAGQVGLLALLLGGGLLSLLVPSGVTWPSWLIAPILIALASAILAGTVIARSAPLRRFAQSFAHAVWARDIRAAQIALSLGTALCNVLAFAFCAVAMDVQIPPLAALILIPLILFAMVLPLSIAGWGLREGAAALLFPAMSASAAEGLATSVAFGLVFLITVLPGALLPLMRPNAPVRPDA